MSDAYAWYEAQRVGLGDEFLAAVDDVFSTILETPMRFRVLVLDTRQALVRRFPYRILYRIAGDEVVVVACFHASRDPRRWEDRR
ncbi:MAG: type II toxin-antitoxin system RelE/ParE family toxin [Planctomycetes bacterium]|nr:type II toxin-antitoxin system RelE/ParE family toxin [Planctomycetota bacterium]